MSKISKAIRQARLGVSEEPEKQDSPAAQAVRLAAYGAASGRLREREEQEAQAEQDLRLAAYGAATGRNPTGAPLSERETAEGYVSWYDRLGNVAKDAEAAQGRGWQAPEDYASTWGGVKQSAGELAQEAGKYKTWWAGKAGTEGMSPEDLYNAITGIESGQRWLGNLSENIDRQGEYYGQFGSAEEMAAAQAEWERTHDPEYLSDATGERLKNQLSAADEAMSISGGKAGPEKAYGEALGRYNEWQRNRFDVDAEKSLAELSREELEYLDYANDLAGRNANPTLPPKERSSKDMAAALDSLRARFSDEKIRRLREYREAQNNAAWAQAQNASWTYLSKNGTPGLTDLWRSVLGETYLDPYLTDEQLDDVAAGAAKTTAGTLASAYSVALAPAKALGNIEALRGILPEWAGGYADPNRATDVNSPWFTANRTQQTIRSAVSENMSEVGRFAYNTLMSAADSALNMALGSAVGGASGLTGQALQSRVANTVSWIMGSQVAADTVMEEIQNGRSNGEALGIGIVRGLFEHISEKYSIENILKTPGRWYQRLRKAFVSEGAEEVASNWMNRVFDVLVLHQSDVTERYNELRAGGMDEAQALAVALVETDGEAFLAGGLSGMVMSGVADVSGVGSAVRTGRQLTTGQTVTELEVNGQTVTVPPVDEATAGLIESGLESPEGTESRELAETLLEKAKAGKTISAEETGRLAQANDAEIRAEASSESRVQSSEETEATQEEREAAQDKGILRSAQNDSEAQPLTAPMNTEEEQANARFDEAREIFVKQAKTGEEAGQVLASLYADTAAEHQSALSFAVGAVPYYYAGHAGKAFEDVRVAQGADITPEQARVAWNEGRIAAVREQAAAERAEREAAQKAAEQAQLQREAERNRKMAASVAGLHEDDFTRANVAADDAKRIDETARLLGTPVYVVGNNEINAGRANGELVEGRAVLLEQSLFEGENAGTRAGLRIAGHEWGHRLKRLAPAEYGQVVDALRPMLTKEIESKRHLYNEVNKLGYSDEALTEEAVNDRLGDMLSDGRILDEFIRDHREDKGLLQRLWEGVKALVRKLTGAEKRAAQSAEAKLRAALDAAVTAASREAGAIVGDPSAQMAEEAASDYSLVENQDTLDFLNGQEYVTVYRAMQEIDGELYPPMAAKVKGDDGKTRLVEPTKLNAWYQADERPDLVKNGKFTLNKGNGSSIAAAYNPYFHTSASPLNDQFSSAYNRPNLVVVEGVIPRSELTSGYRAEGAKDSVGETKWHAGPVASKLKGDKARRVFLSRWFMAQRIVPDAEVAQVVANTLRGEDVAVPTNVVTPSLLAELRKHGVKIKEVPGNGGVKGEFSLKAPIEETKDLLAVHGMTADNLRGALRLGGLPMPSIAVVKADAGHNRYGEISLVFDKSTIDPEADRRNKVYGADAWTPTAPRVDYELDYDGVLKLEDRIDTLSRSVADGIFGNSSLLRSAGVEDSTSIGVDELAEKLGSEDAVKAAYLAEQGEALEPVKKAKVWGKYGNESLQRLIDQIGPQRLAQINSDLWAGMRTSEALGAEEETIRQIIRDYYIDRDEAILQKRAQRNGWTEEETAAKREAHADSMMDNNVSLFTLEDFARNAWAMYEDGGATRGENDYYATQAALRKAVSDKTATEWIRPQIEELYGQPWLYNGKDPYTASGNRRSFRQMHDAYTLENIVKAMSTQQSQRGEGIWLAGAHGLQATATPSYRNIAEIKADSGRLGTVSEEELKRLSDAVNDELDEVVTEIVGTGGYQEREIAGEVLMMAAQGSKTVAAIRSTFARESEYKISEATAKKIQQLYKDAAALPTEYFEAKPQRAVGFDEVLAAVVPTNLDADLKQGLRDAGVQNVLEYELFNNADRTAKLNSVEGARFSLKERDEAYAAAVESGDMETAQRMVDEAAKSAGYTVKAYRGGGEQHNVFDTSRGDGTTQYGPGTYFTDAYGLAQDWAKERSHSEDEDGYVGKYYVKMGNMFHDDSLDTETDQWKRVEDILRDRGVSESRIRAAKNFKFAGIAQALQSIGEIGDGRYAAYDWKNATKVNRILREAGYDGIVGDFYDSKQYVIFDPNMAKSADPVTYDDDGKVIPLSERFNPAEEDIRYHLREPLEGQVSFWDEPETESWTFTENDGAYLREVQKLLDQIKKTKHWTGRELDDFWKQHPEYDFVQRFQDGDKDAKADMQKFVSGIDDAGLLGDMAWYTTRPHWTLQGTYRGAITKATNVFKARAREIIAERVGGHEVKLARREYSFDEIRQLFKDLNEDAAIAKLAEKVFSVAEGMGLQFYATNKVLGERDTATAGANAGKNVFLRINAFADPTISNQFKATTIIHELIHACTVYATTDQYYLNGRKNIQEAVNALDEIYGSLRGDKELAGKYGMKNLKEFAAELANPEFRAVLAKKNLWQRIVEAIRKLFGIETDNALDGASAALDRLLDEMDDVGAREYYREQERKIENWERRTGEQRYHLREPDAATMEELTRENERLRKRVDYWKGQTKQTRGLHLRLGDLNRLTGQLVKDYAAVLDENESAELREAVARLARLMREDPKGLQYSELMAHAEDVARVLVQNASELVNDDEYQDYRDFKKWLRGQKITISRQDAGFIPDFTAWKKAHSAIRVGYDNGGLPIDTAYSELAGQFPGFFPESITNPTDQLERIAEVLDSMGPVYDNPYSADMAAAVEYATFDVLERIMDEDTVRPTPPTAADKQAAAARERMNRRLDEQAERYEARLQKYRDTLKKVRERRDEELARVRRAHKMQQQRQSAAKLRARIERHAKELYRELTRPTDKKHIPEALRSSVAKVLQAINLESGKEYAFVGGDYKLVQRGTELGADPTKKTQLFAAMKEQLAKADNSGEASLDPNLLGFDGETGLLDEVIAMGDKPLADMNRDELQKVWDVLKQVEKAVKDWNKAFAAGRYATISEIAGALWGENAKKRDTLTLAGAAGRAQQLFNLDMLTPEAYFHRLGPTGDALFRALRRAQDNDTRLLDLAVQKAREVIGDYDVRKAEQETVKVTLGGEEAEITRAQLMEIYVLLRREQALKHLEGGILPAATRKGVVQNKRAEPYRLNSIEELAQAAAKLTDEERRIAEALQRFVTVTAAEWGNAASMAVYGYRKFGGEEHYWPLHVNRQDVKSSIEGESGKSSVKNYGFSKPLTPNANNSVRIGSIFDTFAEHTAEMATYSTHLEIMEDLMRVLNYKQRNEEGLISWTTKGIMDRVFGNGGTSYLQTLLEQLSYGVKGETIGGDFMSATSGRYKGSAIGANLRVILQQPTAILRALDMIRPDYLAEGLGSWRRGWQRAQKYAPIAKWKSWGYFDVATGKSIKSLMFNSDSKLSKFNSALMAPAGMADAFAWGQLWSACEKELEAQIKKGSVPGIEPGTEAFFQRVAERFSEIVDRTQVVDGILQRSQIMRSPDRLVKMATSFMAEPTKQYNQFMSAVYDLRHSGGKKERRDAMKHLARTLLALLASFAANAAAQSLIDGLRDDDREKKYFERFLGAYPGNLLDNINPLSFVPWARDVSSLIQGYSVDRMDMTTVSNIVNAVKGTTKALQGEGKKSVANALTTLAAEAARLFGLPVANIKRDVLAIVNTVATETDNYLMQYEIDKVLYPVAANTSRYAGILWQAYQKDSEQYPILYERMVADGINEKKLKDAMENRMKEAQGVTKAAELDQRYMSPDQQSRYDGLHKGIERSGLWRQATEKQRDDVEEKLYQLVAQTDSENSAGTKLQEKIDTAGKAGISEGEYMLYLLALSMADEPSKTSGEYGTYTNDEQEAALDMLDGLSREDKSWLWMSTHDSDKNNPYK